MIYKAIKEMVMETVDGDGFQIGGEGMVPLESLWELNEDNSQRFFDGECRLEALDDNADFSWILITKEDLEENFEKLEVER